MIIKRKSPVTGIVNQMDIDVTEDQIKRWAEGELIQDVMPNLTPDEREFIMTGYTKKDWDEMFPDEDDD